MIAKSEIQLQRINTMHNIDVSIIIVNYKTLELIIACINSIFEHTNGVNFEIIVVDNFSNDNCKRVIEEHFGNKVRVILSNSNLGFGRANNLGFKLSQGKTIFFLNPDTLLINNAIKILYDYLSTSAEIGAVGGNLFDEYFRGTNSYIRYFPGLIYELRKLVYIFSWKRIFNKNEDFNISNNYLEVDGITGADLMIKREIFHKLGGFDPEYFMYLEETDLCRRIKNAGYKLYSVPYAMIQHLEGKSFVSPKTQKLNVIKEVFNEEGRRLFIKKHLSVCHRGLYNIAYLFRISLLSFLKWDKQYLFKLRLFFLSDLALRKKKKILNSK